jgi:hypothetical protein
MSNSLEAKVDALTAEVKALHTAIAALACGQSVQMTSDGRVVAAGGALTGPKVLTHTATDPGYGPCTCGGGH